MLIQNNYYTNGRWEQDFNLSLNSKNTLVIVFSQLSEAEVKPKLKEICSIFPESIICGCSTAGLILNGSLLDSVLSVSVIQFESSQLKLESKRINNPDESSQIGKELSQALQNQANLKNIIIFSEGLNINGSQLIDGFNSVIKKNIVISGGLAGNDDKFEVTWVINDQKKASKDTISAIGIYGNIQSSCASKGGWDMIGIDRLVTKSKNHILFELDNRPALEIYKQYLGEFAENLPSSGLLFPLAIIDKKDESMNKVRTILAVNHKDNSITFAGDIPKGSMVRLMHANFDRLIDGAGNAANHLIKDLSTISTQSFCLSISCVGRKLILGQRVEEEIEAVQNILPKNCSQAGFYSYGELSPMANGTCDLHNQTMTLTLLWEN